MMNLPNLLTALRIVLVPIFVSLMLGGHVFWAILVFTAASVTDGLDGYIARAYRLQTRLGAFLDPLADKLLLLTAYILLGLLGRVPPWLTAVVVARDLVILSGILYLYASRKQIDFAPSLLGKITTFVQLVTILVVLLSDLRAGLRQALFALYTLNLGVTVVSLFHYLYVGFRTHSAFRAAAEGPAPPGSCRKKTRS